MRKFLFAAAVAVSAIASLGVKADAAVFGYVVEGGGTPQVHQLGNGNFLGLVGLDTRNAAQTGGLVGAADLLSAITSNASAVANFYFGRSSLNGSASEFDLFAGPVDVANNTRFFDALWIEWTGGNLVLSNGRGGTATLGSRNVTLAGDPLAPIPLPAAAWMLLAGLGGLAAAGRWRKPAQA